MVQYKVVFIGGTKLIYGQNMAVVANYMAACYPTLWVISITRYPYFGQKIK